MTDQQLIFTWTKSRVSNDLKTKMDAALVQLSKTTGQQFHRITHLWGRMFTCEIEGLLFFSAGNGGRPSTIVVTALRLDESHQVFFPGIDSDDMAACCGILGIENNDDRVRFESFVKPSRNTIC